ncbi:MAG: epimerase [Planctomycetes bacterium]|nr:epimerase [Planctomycetota bacterium]
MTKVSIVTGALGYTGRSLTQLLLARGERVRTLTNSPNRPNPFGERLEIAPLAFDDPGALAGSLEGADTLYNTYWVRFNHKLFTFDQAVANTKELFSAAKVAGVRRVVHVSILHADEADDLGYYKGKHELERALSATGLSHAIVRPGVLFGRGDILVNNIAWVLRHLPIFGVFGDGRYALRPMYVDDMAALMMDCADRREDLTVDAVGPERFTFRELVETIGKIIEVRRLIVRVPPSLGYWLGRCINPFVKDVIITREEIKGLMRSLLDSDAEPTAPTKLTDWARGNRATLGRRYASEVARRVMRDAAYEDL